MQVHKQKPSFESNARNHWKKMPFLRSQTRGQVNNAIEIVGEIYPKKVTSMTNGKSVTVSENSSSRSFDSRPVSPPTCKISNTMFPFPPAPVLDKLSSSSSRPDAKIINISNASSVEEAQALEAEESVSTCHSNASSSLLEESLSLNDAIVDIYLEDSVDASHNSSTVLQELVSDELGGRSRRPSASSSSSAIPISSSAPVTQGVCSSLPPMAMYQHILSTPSGSPFTPSIYIPSEPQEDRNKSPLLLVLQHFRCYEDQTGMERRERIISELDTLVKQWTRSEGLRKNIPWTQVEQVGGKVVSYGSYKLGVVDRESDLDLLCVVPKHVSREDFHIRLFQLLVKKDEVTELRQLSIAYVPVIKMKYRGIDVDLTLARIVCYDKIPNDENFLLNPNITYDMDPRCLRSLNGYRATREVLQLVPDVENFKLTLRVIKLWAKKNGLYGNMIGFLGGASWSILVAKVCQMAGSEGNTMINITNLIFKFFCTFANWEWPKPVLIKREDNQPYGAWNPAMNPLDGQDLMPIITSSVPQMNSAHNMCESNRQLIKAKCAEAVDTLQGIIGGSRSWWDLFQSSSFFEEYNDYIMITSSCLGDASLWFGTVESRLRILKTKITESLKVQSIRIWPMPFDRKEGKLMSQMWFIGVSMMAGKPAENIQGPLYNFQDKCIEMVQELNSPALRSFAVSWQHLPRAQLDNHLTKQEISMGRVEKPSYAAVTMGGDPENTMTSPMAMTSMSGAGYINSGPVLSPAPGAQGDYRHMAQPPPGPYNRVFSAGPALNGFNGVVPPHNYIVYSTLGSQHPGPMMPGQVLNTDQYHNGGGQKLAVVTRPPNHMMTFPPNRSHTSPQPGGYPSRPQPHEHLLRSRGAPGPLKSPQTPGPGQLMASGPGQQPRNSPDHGPGFINIVPNPVASYPHPIPNLTSYPPPPISPMSQFNSPPPPVSKMIATTKSSNQRQESTFPRPEDNQTHHLRVPIKRPKDPSLSEDTRLRSVSNSSDKFPPASLNRARVTHQDQLPVSPGPGVTGVVPLPACVDTSVPPPALPTPPPPASQSSSAVSFNTAKKKAFKIGRYPKISTSEVGEINPPQMERGCRASNNQIKLSLNSSRRADDNVFHNFYHSND